MKSSSPRDTVASSDESNDDERESTPTQLPARPSLVRWPPGRLSNISPGSDEPTQSSEESSGSGYGVGSSGESTTGAKGEGSGGVPESPSDEERLAKLRDAFNAKVLVQQRMRRSYGSSKSDPNVTRARSIQEEGSMSSSRSQHAPLAGQGAGQRTHSTVSTESTESTGTVRASNVATPAGDAPLRTPSYPFPFVPGMSRGLSASLHQPFTALSPTPGDVMGTDARKQSLQSGASTPGPTAYAFMPPGSYYQGSEDPAFPTPNLYDMVLQLNAEPGLEQWWTTVTNLMHDHFKADRATLVIPLDATDMENVPWGQKATFSMNGPEEFVPHRKVVEQTLNATAPLNAASRSEFLSRDTLDDMRPQKLHPERLRPRLEGRHSYAGHGHGREVAKDPSPVRPAGPQRIATHAGGVGVGFGLGRLPAHRLPSTSTLRHGSLNDPAFSSVGGGVDAGPYAEIFSTLRPLDHEVRPLIEPGGVNRVLDRGRVVTVTRDYEPMNSNEDEAESSKTAEATPTAVPTSDFLRHFGNYRSAFASDNGPSMHKDYDEYEQYPTSPWSQSPAPSPAVQADEEVNPFFASTQQQVEDSFNPTSPKDYSQLGQVQTIGIDHASTVIHIPLVHPTISQPMQPLRAQAYASDKAWHPQRSNTLDTERKAPIAILSILCSAVPYPQNLTQSLKLLGPHLATSLAISQQFTSTHLQAVTIRHRRTVSGNNVTTAPMTIEPTSMDDMMTEDIETAHSSISGSMTSPSDYSGRSRHSPGSSVVGTPGWDPSHHGWTSSRSVAGTPGQSASEMVDNYFDAKKRSGQRTASNAGSSVQTPPPQSIRKVPSSENKSGGHKHTSTRKDEPKQIDRKGRHVTSKQEENAPTSNWSSKEQKQPLSGEPTSPERPPFRHSISAVTESAHSKRHSQLHSYGADLQTSFGGLPSVTDLDSHPQTGGHGRKASYSEEMPPPSERLLRTIIDSVPVQIFTAEPDTGRLTWVNSKFLIYRGQEPWQILSEPWQALHPDDRKDFLAAWHRSLRTTQQLQQKVRLERFDGNYRWFYVRAAPLKDKRQKIVHWIGTMMDFHEQHLAEVNLAKQQETAASEAKYRALANSSPQIVFAVSKAKGVTFCNTQWVHFSGQSEAQARGVGFMDHVHPDDLAKCKLPSFEEGSDTPKNVPTSVPPDLKRNLSASASSSGGSSETEKPDSSSSEPTPFTAHMPQRKLSELASTGILRISRDADGRPSYSTEVRLKSRDGDFRWHLVRLLLAEPLLQSHEDEETWYGTCTDINDHKALERDLKETMDEKSRFLSNMSHEIRTPLNGITGMVNFLIDSSLTPEQMEHVSIIRASTEGLRGLINDILDLSKAEAGMIQLNMDWMYARALIEEVNDLTSAMAIDKGLELNYLVEENVPTRIKGDRFRIRQILLNVVGNAIKFTHSGEVFVRCSTYKVAADVLEENEMFIRFDVIDTGRGFTDEEAEFLFKRFSQIDGSSTRQHGGTGLGLVISRQLAQLHGGDMSAKGVPGKGATFTFFIKTNVPSKDDQPPAPLATPLTPAIPILPMTTGSVADMPIVFAHPALSSAGGPKASPRFAPEQTQSPSPYASPMEHGRESPSVSSAGSSRSLISAARTSSLRSERSSASSFMPEIVQSSSKISLTMPEDVKAGTTLSQSTIPFAGDGTQITSPSQAPLMYSILVLCPLKYSREATAHHIDKMIPNNIPHQITARNGLKDCQEMIGGDEPVLFTHIVAVLQDIDEITALVKQVMASPSHQSTNIVVITDFAQRRKIMEEAPEYDYEKLAIDRRLRFVFKPLKPSRFAAIFDPQKEREMSFDRNQDSAAQVALTQKQVFEELKTRLGNRDKRVLLVEDNRTNQLVVLKFLAKVSITAETAADGLECTNKVFSKPPGYYSIILCDLHMPNKDGYQTCKEIREWERQEKYPHLPIIALSANVLGDVHKKCVQAGFNSYLTKPVDFKELSAALMVFMDPSDPSKPHEFMKIKRTKSLLAGQK